jgi:hypothetical protein
MAAQAATAPFEESLPPFWVARSNRARLDIAQGANVGDKTEDLAAGQVCGRHRGAGNTPADDVRQVVIGRNAAERTSSKVNSLDAVALPVAAGAMSPVKAGTILNILLAVAMLLCSRRGRSTTDQERNRTECSEEHKCRPPLYPRENAFCESI